MATVIEYHGGYLSADARKTAELCGPEKGLRIRISQKVYLEPKWLRCHSKVND